MSTEALWLLQGHEVNLNLGNKLFYNSTFFTETPVIWNRFHCFHSCKPQLYPKPYDVNWTMDYPSYFPGMKGRGVGVGEYSTKFYTGNLWPLWANSFCIPSTDKWCPFHTPSLEFCIPLNCCKCTVLTIWTSNNCKLGECVRWGGGGGGCWVVSGTGKGVQNLMGL